MIKIRSIIDPYLEQIMVDLETISTANNAVIVSIGATRFTLHEGIIDKFSINVDPFDAKKYGLHIDPDTIAWWKKQPKEVSDLWKVNPVPLKEALNKFDLFYGPKLIPIYGNSASFDVDILESSHRATNMAIPWDFRDGTCFRTICKMFPDVEYERAVVAHSALDDAITQTNHLLKLLA